MKHNALSALPIRWAGKLYVPPAHLRQRLSLMLFALDLAAMSVALVMASLLRHGDLFRTPEASLALAVTYFLFAFSNGAYAGVVATISRPDGVRRAVSTAVKSFLAALLTVIFLVFVLKEQTSLSRAEMLMAAILFLVLVSGFRWHWTQFVGRNWPDGVQRVGLIRDHGAAPAAGGFAVTVECDDWLDPSHDCPRMHERLSRQLIGCDRIVVACEPDRREEWSAMLRGMGLRTEFLAPELRGTGVLDIAKFGAMQTLVIDFGPMKFFDRVAKRIMDIAISLPALILLSPLLLATAIAIKLDSRGPVLFRQQRLGLANRRFEVLKFRSMTVDGCDGEGAQSTRRGDARVTRVGEFIRKTSIDELPQLLNVLGGSMSLVGPRPHALGSRAGDQLFWNVDNRYWHRHAVKPGLTGLAQVRGHRGATHTIEDLSRRLASDLEYVRDWSLFLDLWIIVATLRVLVHKNAY